MDHKPLVFIFKKDLATPSQRLPCILLKIHQFKVNIIYKPGPNLYIADWVSRQIHKDRYEEIACLQVSINTIDIGTATPTFMMQEIWKATVNNTHLQHLQTYIVGEWDTNRADVKDVLP